MRKFLDSLLKTRDSHRGSITTPLPLEVLAFYLGQSSGWQGPQLVIVESLQQAEKLIQNLRLWSKKPYSLLPNFNPSVYSDVLLSPSQVHQRLSWLFHAINDNENHIFIATLQALCQKTLPLEDYMDACLDLAVGDELPKNFFSQLHDMGYQSRPLVEDPGSYSNRGGLVDIFPPHLDSPIRMELFDSEIESLHTFDSTSQMRQESTSRFSLSPAREVLLNEKNCLQASQELLKLNHPDLQALVHDLRRGHYSENLEYHLPLFYEETACVLDYFSSPPQTWFIEELNIETRRQSDMEPLKHLYKEGRHPLSPDQLHFSAEYVRNSMGPTLSLERLNIIETAEAVTAQEVRIAARTISLGKNKKTHEQIQELCHQLKNLPDSTLKLITVKGEPQFQRLKNTLEPLGFRCQLHSDSVNIDKLRKEATPKDIFFPIAKGGQSYHLPSEDMALISFDHLIGRPTQTHQQKNDRARKRAQHLSFGELKEGDFVIHALHGVCRFLGFEKMPLAGIENEFLVLEFKDKDKLFLPIYRIHQVHKYSSEKVAPQLDKLGGQRFEKAKAKTKKRLREIAHDLVRLYAERSQLKRPPYNVDSPEVTDFFNAFPYQETEDQLSAMEDIIRDLCSDKPMDRLLCGDVGFGKTEIAMRAAFIVAHNQRQVALLAPTTVLTMQHYETLKKRFEDWPIEIAVINRLQTNKNIKATLQKIEEGKVDIVIGTHRLLSQDVKFNKLGLLVVDEEQKFGVKHKERIRKLKTDVDTISLSATPIPRTLNMSLLKMRDLSLINTPPMDRLAVRTLICRHDKEIIRRAVETEIHRGGQVFFLHNRVQSIYAIAEELRALLPGVPIGVGHGQLSEKELESVMMSFFKGDLQVLVASSIVESGVDIPNANTILINQADRMGLSQLYQLRGRVGRSGRRAYCYLLTDTNKVLSDVAKERLKVIQENTKLGSGLQIAQYDLELRGAGTLLGEEQSGAVETMGYEFYMELLEEAIQEAQGQDITETVEPELNLKIKALIPNTYIPNTRLRLAYYRALTQVKGPEDVDQLEEELKDQFGTPPAEVINLLGLMLIRHLCIRLGVKDISHGKLGLVLSFTDKTPLPGAKVIELTSQENKKYSITPNHRLKVRMHEVTWPRVMEELQLLLSYCPS